jgi:hypothetical protein
LNTARLPEKENTFYARGGRGEDFFQDAGWSVISPA